MNLEFYHKKDDELSVHKKIRETIEFHESYIDDQYRSREGEDFDMGFIAGLKKALQIVEETPVQIKERIIYRNVMTDHVLIQKVYVNKYAIKKWEEKSLKKGKE